MTATGRSKRLSAKHDVYPTPRWAVMRFLEEWPLAWEEGPMHWLEPGAGDGSIIRTVNEFREINDLAPITWTAFEVRKLTLSPLSKLAKRAEILDFTSAPLSKLSRRNRERPYVIGPGDTPPPQLYDAAIMNPPFLLTMEFLRTCRKLAQNVAMLQRQNFIGSEDRNEELRSDMPDQWMIPERVDFTGDGHGDAIGHSWWTWGDHEVQVGELHLLKTTPIEERRADRPRIVHVRPVPTDGVFKTRKRNPNRPPRVHSVPKGIGALFA